MVYGHIVENEMQDIEAVQCMRMIGFNITFLVYALSMKREGTNSIRSMMKQDLEGEKLFRQIVDETPAELKTQLRFSDSIAEKSTAYLKREVCRRENWRKKLTKPKPRFRVGLAAHTISPSGHWPKFRLCLARI